MDRIKYFEECILEILVPFSKLKFSTIKDGGNSLVVDKENRRYQVITMGWEKGKFIHECPLHFDIINGKIWVQRNMTDIDLDDFFWTKGISKSEIVLGFLQSELRADSSFATA